MYIWKSTHDCLQSHVGPSRHVEANSQKRKKRQRNLNSCRRPLDRMTRWNEQKHGGNIQLNQKKMKKMKEDLVYCLLRNLSFAHKKEAL